MHRSKFRARSLPICTFLFFVFLGVPNAQAQFPNTDCSQIKGKPLHYLSIPDSSAYILLSDTACDEYFQSGRYRLHAKVEWRGSCTYDMVLESADLPGFPYKTGDVMSVEIVRIDKGIVQYTSTINGGSWEGKLRMDSLK